MNTHSLVNTALIVLIAVVALIGGNQSEVQTNNIELGAGTRFPNGISTDSTSPSAGEVRTSTFTTTGAATLGGDLTVTTSNTATSSASFGCWDTHATSTETAVRLSATTTAAGGTIPLFVFGSCSGL